MNLTEEIRHSIIERLQLTEKLAKEANLELYNKEFVIERKELQLENSKKLESKIKSSFKNCEDGIIYTIELLDCDQYQDVKKHFENFIPNSLVVLGHQMDENFVAEGNDKTDGSNAYNK